MQFKEKKKNRKNRVPDVLAYYSTHLYFVLGSVHQKRWGMWVELLLPNLARYRPFRHVVTGLYVLHHSDLNSKIPFT